METQMKTMTPRRSVKVQKKELATWKTEFDDYGSKIAAERATGVPVQTIRNIVNNGRGSEEYVERLRVYVASRRQKASQIAELVTTYNAA